MNPADRSVLREGIVAGLIGAAVVAIWFFVFDLLRGRPFLTPTLLGSFVFFGVNTPTGLDPAPGPILGYTVLHGLAFVAFGIVAGALIGIPAVVLGGIEIGLSLSVGVLLGGLACGWLRSMWPRFVGRIPGPTLWVFESVGLAGFVAVVGLNAGPDFVVGLRTSGASLLVAGLVTVLTPHLVGVVVGRWLFRMQPGVLLGVCAGAGTATPALAAIQEAADSQVPTLGYGVAYAVGNVLLALWGTLIVALL